MSLVPRSIEDLLNFCELHTGPWTLNAAGIGLLPGQAAEFLADTTAARAAYTARLEAIEAAREATEALRVAARSLRQTAAEDVRLIRAYAQSQDKPSTVYALAQIPPPAAPSVMPPPGQPFDFRVSLDPLGAITLKWKCANPAGAAGTVYNVRRRLGVEGPYALLGAVGARSFVDDTLPAGTAQVQYTVQGQRAGSIGIVSFPFTINFGVGGGGVVQIASAFTQKPAKSDRAAA